MSVLALSDSQFSTDVLSYAGLVVVDVWAEWCTPCRALVPVFERLAERYEGRARVAKLDADANPETVTRYDVRALPTVLIFQRGVLVERLSGARTLADYVAAIDAQLTRGHDAPIELSSAPSRVLAPTPARADSDAVREARDLLASEAAVLVFKHSNSCPVSFTAKKHYDAFVSANPDVPTRLVVVQRERELSNALASVSQVRHESPQALVVRHGHVLWNASHGGITMPSLEQAFMSLPASA